MDAQVCVANIGPTQRRQRRRAGIVSLAVGTGLAVGTATSGSSPTLVALAAALVFGGFTGVFQARAKT